MSLVQNSQTEVEQVIPLSAPVVKLMSEFLHAMGQPLTILQACHLFAASSEESSEQITTLLPEWTEQIRRVTELYQGIRSLFEAEAGAVRRNTLSFTTLLDQLTPEWHRRAARKGVDLLLSFDGQANILRMDAGRGAEALACFFDAALVSTVPSGSLKLSLISGESHKGIMAESNPCAAGYSPSASLALRVAEALIQAEGGRVQCEDFPMRLQLELPSK